MQRTRISEIFTSLPVGETVRIGGWVRTTRHSKGGFSFLAINDGSCFGQLQVVADQSLRNYDELLHLTAGCSVLVVGTVVESQGKGQAVELQAGEVRVLGPADPDQYPIQPKQHSFEFLRSQAHLRPRTNTFGAVARVRNRICSAIHEFFQHRGFLYIHTPIITASDCEGAGELFRVTTLDPDTPPRDETGAVDHTQDFFARQAYLTVSGQLEVETHCCALGDVYTFGPTFRAENSNTPRHLAEFWMVEPEMAFCDLAGDADLAEQFLQHILLAVMNDCPDDMAFFDQRVERGLLASLQGVVEQTFVHLPYTEAIEILESAGRTWEFPVCWGCDLKTEHERYLTEEKFRRPVVITDFPAEMKPFYMYVNEPDAQGRRTVRAMDILVPRIGEIIGGSEREYRLDVLDARMDEQGLDKDAYWWYRDLRKFGSIPHAGFGLGLERCVQFCTGMANIRDVIPFPRTPRAAEF